MLMEIGPDSPRDLLITSTTGLYRARVNGSVVQSIHRDLWWSCFGISEHEGAIYLFVSDGINGRVLRVHWDEYGLASAEPVISSISRKCHQITIHADLLYITDPQDNQVLVYQLADMRRIKKHRMPKGTYHVNSISVDDSGIEVMLHNKSSKTGKSSQILRCDHDFKNIELVDTDAWNAHNIGRFRNERVYCDSHNESLVVGDQRITVTGFTRGLAIEGDTALVGGSPVVSRIDRSKGDCGITEVDLNSLQVRGHTTIPHIGSIHDILPYPVTREDNHELIPVAELDTVLVTDAPGR